MQLYRILLLGCGLFTVVSCQEVFEPEPLELDNFFMEEGVIEDVLILSSLELDGNQALVKWEVDSSRLSSANLEVISGIRISYNYSIRPDRDFPFADGSMVHPLLVSQDLHCFSAYAYRENVTDKLRLESRICESY